MEVASPRVFGGVCCTHAPPPPFPLPPSVTPGTGTDSESASECHEMSTGLVFLAM